MRKICKKSPFAWQICGKMITESATDYSNKTKNEKYEDIMLKVLIADDEEKICQLIEKLINWESLGLKVAAVASNGVDAVKRLWNIAGYCDNGYQDAWD